jgi:predicted phosphoribosyltransferase
MPTLQFKNRRDAGAQLALKIPYCDAVIAIPRGGIPIAEPICIQHQVPLLLTSPRKLGAPKNPEFAFGAVSEYGDVILNQ